MTSTRTSTNPSTSLQNMSTSTSAVSTSAANTSAAIAGTSAQPKTPVAVISGATVGGVILLSLLLALLLLYLKRRHRAAVPPPIPTSNNNQTLTAATLAASPAALSPSPVSSPQPGRHVEPFLLQTPNDDGLRTETYYEKNGQIQGDVRNTHSDHSVSSGVTSSAPIQTQTQMQAGELGVTINRLHELAEKLNRGLAEQGPSTPRLMLVSGRDAELLMANWANGNVDHGHERDDSMMLPPYEGRLEES